jgi:hypothetical protein
LQLVQQWGTRLLRHGPYWKTDPQGIRPLAATPDALIFAIRDSSSFSRVSLGSPVSPLHDRAIEEPKEWEDIGCAVPADLGQNHAVSAFSNDSAGPEFWMPMLVLRVIKADFSRSRKS